MATIKIKTSASKLLLIIALVAAVSVAIWYLCATFKKDESAQTITAQDCYGKYSLLDEQQRCGEKPKISKADYLPFKNKLIKEIENFKALGKATSVSVYFRDLEDGPIFGINEQEKFIPASLLKLPLMITYFRLADEDDQDLLTRIIIYKGDYPDTEQFFASNKTIEIGKPYSVDEMIHSLIAYSDNRAWWALINYMYELYPNSDPLLETYQSMGIVEPTSSLDSDITVKSYAGIFRALFKVSYLSNNLSNKALQYLLDTDYGDGLKAGVPEGIKIANKFGERTSPNEKELHDCGIIYYPDNPYLLCVMTKGFDFNAMASVITTVSKSVYEEVDSRRVQ